MRHWIEAGAAQSGGGLDIVAIIVAGQEGDGDIRARGEVIVLFRKLMPARGNLDGSARQQRGQIAGLGQVGCMHRTAPEHQA